MAELGFSCKSTASSEGSGVDVDRRVIRRIGGCFEAGTPLSLTSPGAGWVATGDEVTYSGGTEFVNTSQVFHNGDILLTTTATGTGCDVEFLSVSGSTVGFGFNIDENDIIQVWKFAAASGTA